MLYQAEPRPDGRKPLECESYPATGLTKEFYTRQTIFVRDDVPPWCSSARTEALNSGERFFYSIGEALSRVLPRSYGARPDFFRRLCAECVPAVWADVEERPFQGRVTNEVRRALAPVVALE